MPDVNLVAVQNKTDRHYFVGDVEVGPGEYARVDGDNEFLSTLVGRGDFARYDNVRTAAEEKVSDPEVAQPEAEAEKPAPQTKKQRGAQPTTEGDN